MRRTKVHILFAQNDEFLSDIYKKKFEEADYKVTVVNNGDACIREAEKKLPHIIILDVLLPKLDGFSVIDVLKKDLKTQKIPIIIFTQLGQKEDVKRGLDLGAAEYILKSHVKPDDLIGKVKEILQTH